MSAPLTSREILRAHLREMPLHRVIIRSIEASILMPVDYPRPILDVGCGDGHFAAVTFPEGIDVGLDPGMDETMESSRRGVYRLVIRSDSTEMPFPDRSFGSIVSNCVFEHIPDIDRTVSEIGRVLRPGGRFATTVIADSFRDLLTSPPAWARLGLSGFHRSYVDWFNRKAIHYHFDPPEKWIRRFERAGLRVEAWRYYMSPRTTRAFHWAHYLSLPHLVFRQLTGRWVPFPGLFDRPFWIRRYLPLVEEPPPELGSCIAFVCTRG
ncbi:MAG TPA: class I SAM-dependent methyltransferase [Thermoanaerobaculia bacterium]|nr:class I SAM-dependent methyltransferase [Thermoanaerobaculia bacterium]